MVSFFITARLAAQDTRDAFILVLLLLVQGLIMLVVNIEAAILTGAMQYLL